jgi:transposase
MLMRAFLGWLRGERRHCSMAAIPTIEEEDAERPNREHEKLVGDRTRIMNRMKSTLYESNEVNAVTPRNPRVQAHFTQG